jgi:transcription elongation factor Elf1
MDNTTIPVSKGSPTIEQPKQNALTTVVKLPSKGYFYPSNHPLASGTVEIYQVTARHEDILNNANYLKKGIVLDEFLKALIATPNITLNDILIGDKNALFIAARKNAYGDIYTTKIKCPSCNVESNIDINLDELTEKPFKMENFNKGENKFNFVLPASKKTITWAFMTHKDESDIDQEIKALSKIGMNTSAPEITTRLKYVIKSVDGDSDRVKIKNFVDTQLTAKDSMALRRYIRDVTPDIDLSFNFTCPACGHQEKMSVPLGGSFFWPNINDV